MDKTRGKFVLKAPYQPSGDQPQAIEALTKGVNAGMKGQVLLGVTGSGKTFTMASGRHWHPIPMRCRTREN